MKQQILVIDEDISMCCLMQSILSEKYRVVCMDNIWEACCWLSDANFPDLIISDLSTSGMDGIEFLKILQGSGFYKNTPVIILSRLDDDWVKTQCLHQGAIAYVKKPFGLESLIEAVDQPLVSKMF